MQTNEQICLVCSVRETVIIISQLLTQLPGLFLSPVFFQPVVIYLYQNGSCLNRLKFRIKTVVVDMCVQSTSRARIDILTYQWNRENATSYTCKQITVGIYPEVTKYHLENNR